MTLLDTLREEIGLPMRGSYPSFTGMDKRDDGSEVSVTRRRWFGWTTDKAKADAAREAGAVVSFYQASEPEYNGWEVTFTEVVEDDRDTR